MLTRGGRVVLPSVMSADQMRAGEQVEQLMDAGARAFHVDVMDAHFVPNLTLGANFTSDLAELVHSRDGVVDVHLMVERPAVVIPEFAEDADAISVHMEADPHPHRLLHQIREAGCLAGIALNPGTPVEALRDIVHDADYVNVLSVDPGFAGQAFIERTPERIARLRELAPPGLVIEVDGGIELDTLPQARDVGADLFVSASAIFGHDDISRAYVELAELASR
jgi:ribulose-phosphate 3-epimerase